MKDGGNTERKSAIFEILYYENRFMYFIQNNTLDKYPKLQHVYIKNSEI